MPSKFVILGVILAADIIDTVRVRRMNNRRFNEGKENRKELETQLEYAHAQVAYLCGVLEKHEIDLDEFDILMLNNLS